MLESESILQNRYQIKQQLSDNPVRQTWLAEDLESRSRVVVKLLTGAQMQWEDFKLFEREAEVLKQLNHSQIPKYRDYFAVDDRTLWFGLVHEYIPGVALKQLILEGQQFAEEQVCQIAKDVLDILIYLHELSPQVLHRDIKPSNLILGADDRVYLVDFGAVQNRTSAAGATFTVVGTYGYTPIEQYGGQAVPASDLYALGASLIYLLTGVAPADLPQRDLRIQWSDRIKSNVTVNFVSWIEHLTQPALERRFSSAVQARKALDAGKIIETVRGNIEAPADTHIILNKSMEQLEISIPARIEVEIIEPIKKALNGAVEGLKGRFKKLVSKIKDSEILTSGSILWRVGAVFVSLVVIGLTLPVFLYTLGILILLTQALIFIGVFVLLGNWLAKRRSYFERTYVYFDASSFAVEWQLVGVFNYRRQKGITVEIQDVSVASHYENNARKNAPPQLGVVFTTGIFQGQLEKYAFGQELSENEMIWLVQEIRDWLGNRPR